MVFLAVLQLSGLGPVPNDRQVDKLPFYSDASWFLQLCSWLGHKCCQNISFHKNRFSPYFSKLTIGISFYNSECSAVKPQDYHCEDRSLGIPSHILQVALCRWCYYCSGKQCQREAVSNITGPEAPLQASGHAQNGSS